jgi:hypothetical protein
MQHFPMRFPIGKGEDEAESPSLADQFAEIMGRIRAEYDLEPDVWGAAEDVFQALKAREWLHPERGRAVYM